MPVHQVIKRRSAGAAKRNDFTVQHCVVTFRLFGYAGGQISEPLHFVAAARNEPTATLTDLGERPKTVMLELVKPFPALEQIAPANRGNGADLWNHKKFLRC